MDYDADGILDFISGSYDPGDLYLFRGLGKGEYAKRELLRDENGVPLVHHPKDLVIYHKLKKARKKVDAAGKKSISFRIASFGSWPAMVDWDADGDLDMLIGTFSGQLYLRTNKGTRSKPVFAAKSVLIHLEGGPMRVQGHLAPVVVDWDGDGSWDIVAGSADGSVCWFPNTGTKAKPEFAAKISLLPASAKTKFRTQYLGTDEDPARGTRAQICVTDYNGDGKLDLLVGDYSDVWRQRTNLSEEELAELSGLAAKEKRVRDEKDTKSLTELVQKKITFYEKKGRQSYIWLYLRH